MILFYLIILSLIIWKIQYKRTGFYTDYLDIPQCNAIKGIFILLVFMRHILQYICGGRVIGEPYEMSGILDVAGALVDNFWGQLIVTLFLFYSGYGVMESVKYRGEEYVNRIPLHRIVPTFLNFDVAVLSFLIINIIFGIHYDLLTIFLSFTGWESIGNSNWYIFDIILCYALFYVIYRCCKPMITNSSYFVLAMFLATLLSLYVISRFQSDIWYNTLFCFPFGILWSIYKDKLEKFWYNHYCLSLFILFALFVLLFLFPYDILGGIYNIKSIIFCSIIVLITMRVKIGNPILVWLGFNLFPLYIYQRIPMIVLNEISQGTLPTCYPYLYIVLCMLLTCLIAFYYPKWRIKIA